MIFDVQTLKEAMDYRDETLVARHQKRVAGLRTELKVLEKRYTEDRAEIRKRAMTLVERIDSGGPVSATAIRSWFTVSRENRPLGRPTSVIARLIREIDASERYLEQTVRPGEVQSFLQILLDNGVALVQSSDLAAGGYRYEFESWIQKHNKAQARRRFEE